MRRYHVYLIVWVLFLVALSLIPGRITPAHKFPMDKILHFFAFSYLGYLTSRSFGWWAAILVLAFGAGNEFLQLLAPGRQVGFWDIAFNEAGIITGYFLGYWRKKRALSAG
ncbi:VanZ family protein [bacterium]|nr:VanZ family protein [bacterium]